MAERFVQKTKNIYPGDLLYVEVQVIPTGQQVYTPCQVLEVHDKTIGVVFLAGERICIDLPKDKPCLWEHQSNCYNFRPLEEIQ